MNRSENFTSDTQQTPGEEELRRDWKN